MNSATCSAQKGANEKTRKLLINDTFDGVNPSTGFTGLYLFVIRKQDASRMLKLSITYLSHTGSDKY